MSIKPEFSLRQVKESFKTNKFEIPKGAFIGRLYWSDFSKYIQSGVKLDGCYVISDNKLQYHRKVEFIISNLETAELLLRECAQSNLIAVRKATATVIGQMRGWVQGKAELLKPIVNAAKSAVTQVIKTVVNTVKKRFPRNWDDCQSLEEVQFIFDRTPAVFRSDKFVFRYLEACARFEIKKEYPIFPSPWDMSSEAAIAKALLPLAVKPQLCLPAAKEVVVGLSLDDVCPVDFVPGEVQMESAIVEHIPASESQVRKMFAEGFKSNQRRCKQWIIGVGKSIPGYQVIVKGSDKRTAAKIMEQVIECVLLAQLSVSELSSILTA